MKRNLDLVREILLWMEAQPEGQNVAWKIQIDGFTDEEIGYHAYLMHQAGLIIATDATFLESHSPHWIPTMLTWQGHEFLSAAKDDTVWAKAKKDVIKPALGATYTVILEWLKAEAKARLGLP